MKISNSTYWIFICVILVFLNIYSLYQNDRITKDLNEELSGIKSQYESRFQSLLTRIDDQLRNEGLKVNQEIQVFPDIDNNKKIKLDSLINNEFVLVLNFSDISCTSCIESEIKIFQEFAKEIGYENVLILSSYRRNNDLLVFKRLNKLEVPIYNKKDQNLGLQLDDSKISIFILDSTSFKTECFFIPDTNNPELSKNYYDRVKYFFE